ncbi:MAG TPA: glycosyltransferase family 2 protein [Solirubrobacteraceae bacterium]|nr:glycosyltransferase family 2 protein [Solirubrobacteraceae bacterium]
MRASVVIRVRDEAAALGELLARLARQTLPHELVVVDSGSRDGSPEAAAAAGARVIGIAASEFTFGGALNRGTAAASGDVVVALSAHAFPRDDGWLERMAASFDDPAVACAFGAERDWAGAPLAAPVRQDAVLLRAHPEWGYSNGAGGFRRALWAERPFREDMPGTEDREWSLWALEARGGVCVLDPALAVDHDHAGDSLRECFVRWEREARGYAMFLDLPPYGARDALREWWGDQGWHRSRARARLDPRRAARLAGKWRGRRAARV